MPNFFGNNGNDKLENLMDLLRLEKGVFFSQNENNPIIIPSNTDCRSAIEGILSFVEIALNRNAKRVEAYPKKTSNGSLMVVRIDVPDINPKNPVHKLVFHFDVSRCEKKAKGMKGNDWGTWDAKQTSKIEVIKEPSILDQLFNDDIDIDISLK